MIAQLNSALNSEDEGIVAHVLQGVIHLSLTERAFACPSQQPFPQVYRLGKTVSATAKCIVIQRTAQGSRMLVHLPPHGGLLIGGPGNGAPPPSKSSPYAIIYSPRAETKHTSKVHDAAPLNDCLRELIRTVIFVLINHGCFAKLGPLQGFNFFNTIH